MKNIFFLFAILLYCGSTAQTYTFDYILTYENISNNALVNESNLSHILLNSKNKDYAITIYNSSGEARLIDDKTKKIFVLNAKKDPKSSNFNFEYVKQLFGAEQIKTTINFKKKTNNSFMMRRKISNTNHDAFLTKDNFTIVESEDDLLFIENEGTVNFNNENVDLFKKLINSNKNYVVKKISSNHFGNKHVSELKRFEKVYYTVEIPDAK